MAATAFHNKVMVAEHYTIDARMADPSASVLEGVTDDADTAMMAINNIDNPPAPPEEPVVGQTFVLTTVRDDIDGTMADDLIVAEPVAQVSNVFQETLNPFDDIDGGDGNDTIAIYGVVAAENLELGAESVSNVENAILNTVGGITANMSHWDGLESVNLERYGRTSDVSVTVDGAMVSAERPFGGDVTIVGAAGAVNVEAGGSSMVHIGSAGHTESVMVSGGASITVDGNGRGGQSKTIASVSVTGAGSHTEEAGTLVKLGDANEDGTIPLVAPDGTAITNDGSDDNTDASAIVFDPSTGIISGELDGVTPTPSVGREMGMETEFVNAGASLKVHSDAISNVSLTGTDAIVLVKNDSMTEDEQPMPEDLHVTVNKYGKHKAGAMAGKLCIDGAGSAENIMIDVMGNSDFALASNAVKSLSVMADANLVLDVNRFDKDNPDLGPSNTLESITIVGSGNVEIADATFGGLMTVDASGASGDVIIGKGAMGFGKSVTSYMGGSGFDCISVATFAAKGLTVDLGAGNDIFKAGAANKDSRADGGDGMDTLMLTSAANSSYTGEDKKSHSIYTNFETLDAGGNNSAAAAYDIAMLGVDNVQVTRTAPETVTFNNMKDGMGISVHGEKPMTADADGGTTATIIHDMIGREPGEPRFSGQLEVALLANGNKDTKAKTDGEVMLTLTVADEIDTLIISSNANASAAAGTNALTRPTAADYQNTIIMLGVNEEGATVEEIFVSGGAKLFIDGAVVGTDATDALTKLELLDASANSGGVTFNGGLDVTDSIAGHDLTQALELFGGSGADTLHGGAGIDEITGGAGGDMLAGGGAADMFIYNAASESMLSFVGTARAAQGTDVISDFLSGTDKIVLSKAIWAEVRGKPITEYSIGDTADDEGTNLYGVVDSQGKAAAGGGFFITVAAAENNENLLGGGTQSTQHGIVSVTDTEDNTRWIFIDANGDGKYSSDDLVIKLVGDSAVPGIALADFDSA